MTEPRVSVAVPCYNQGGILADTLESLVAQDYDNLRIIVSDDASTDDTLAVARSYERRFPGRVVVQAHERNLGVTGNVRSMEPLIEGDYLCWFAGDDICLPTKIRKQVQALEAAPEAALCYHDLDVFDGASGRSLYRYNDPLRGQPARAGRIAAALVRERCFIGAISMMVRRSLTEGLRHRPELPRVSDWLYLIEICHRGPAIYLDEVLARYRRHPQNVTGLIDITDEAASYAMIQRLYPEYGAEAAEGLLRLKVNYVFKTMLTGHYQSGLRLLREVAREARRSPRKLGWAASESLAQLPRRLALLQRTGRLTR